MPDRITLKNITIILHQPRYPENIGAAARAACNMGIGHLKLVQPKNYDVTKVMRLATHAASHLIEKIEIYNNLYDAVSEFNYIVGTTARLGGERHVVTSPSGISEKLISISEKNRVAIIFGPEDRGLSNEDIQFCHILVNISTVDFSSINLGQAVMIICYEICKARTDKTEKHICRLAGRHELEGMYDQLKDILVRINYINPENPNYWMIKLRDFFNRVQLRAKEVSVIRGICRQIDWYGNKRFQDGKD